MMHPAKRRHTEKTTSSLAKPFRSPLHVDRNKQNSLPEEEDNLRKQEVDRGAKFESALANDTTSISSPISRFTTPTNNGFYSSLSSPARSSSARAPGYDSEYSTLVKQYSALCLRRKDLVALLDTTGQAFKISQSKRDQELEDLITKWQIASRSVVEDLFSAAREHVSHMGGVRAWRENNLKQREHRSWDDESETDTSQLNEEQKEQFEIALEEAKIEHEKYGQHQDQTMSDVQEDNSFTIEVMLKQLNIGLDVIGYDAQTQQWNE